MSDLVGNPNCWFSHAKAHLICLIQIVMVFQYFLYSETDSDKKWACYYSVPELKYTTEQQDKKYIVCFITEEHRQIDVYPLNNV